MAYKYLNDDGLKAYTKKVKGALKDLHTPIAISTENTTESNAQNVRNIADFVAKAKAAGIADVDGMAVSCILDDDYSGVGYFYMIEGTFSSILGVKSIDDISEHYVFNLNSSGYYAETLVLTAVSSNVVTSDMLTQGARKPIILTPMTTEVDEETYQKLISDDVDVMFKTADEGNLCTLTYKTDNGDCFSFHFTCFSREGESLSETYFYGYEVRITKIGNPHPCEVIDHSIESQFSQILLNEGFTNRSFLSPVLQEIDLTGTDAERKDKLAKFEIYWKALTGASDMYGARFVGIYDGYSGIFFMANETYMGYCSSAESNEVILTNIDVRTGSANYISVSSQIAHLIRRASAVKAFGAIELKASDNAANKAALTAYKKILTNAEINITNGYSVPVRITGNAQEYHGMLNIGTGTLLSGIVTDANETHHYPFKVSTADGAITFDANNYFLEKTSTEVIEMLDAIKYSYTQVPLTATTSTNKTQLDLFLSKVPNAQVMHCTYKDVYAGTLNKINGSWYGILVGESNTLSGQLSIKLQADGTIVEGTA